MVGNIFMNYLGYRQLLRMYINGLSLLINLHIQLQKFQA